MARKETLDALRDAQDRAQAMADAILTELRRRVEEERNEQGSAISSAPPADPDATPVRAASELT